MGDDVEEMARRAVKEIERKDRRHKIHKYRDCLLGSDIVSWISRQRDGGKTRSKRESVEVANEWQRRKYLIHVSDSRKAVEDSSSAFYRWSSPPSATSSPSPSSPPTSAACAEEEESASGSGSAYNPLLLHFMEDPRRLEVFAESCRSQLSTTDTKIGFKEYKDVFSGDDLTTWVLANSPVPGITRAHAVAAAGSFLEVNLVESVLKLGVVRDAVDAFYRFGDRLRFKAECLKQRHHQKKMGLAMRDEGLKPKYPVILVPGLASSALEVFESDTKPDWIRTRVWIDPMKIGNLQKAQAIQNKATKVKDRLAKKAQKHVPSEHVDLLLHSDKNRDALSRVWLKHMVLAEDGFSDPPGIRVRPVPGLHGCDFLGEGKFDKKPSYVLGFLIEALCNFGYDTNNLTAMPYDWRIPPEKLEERDRYYTRLMRQTELMFDVNGEKVVLVGHSMGNRCLQYFFAWVEKHSPGWCETYVQSFLAMGAPFLGAPKVVRSVVSGDQLGLDMFLLLKEGLAMARANASLPWLFPLREEDYPNDVAYCVDGPQEQWTSHDVQGMINKASPRSWGFYEDFYLNSDLFLAGGKALDSSPILTRPPVNIWCVYGVNLRTEVSYYFASDPDKPAHFSLSAAADHLSYQKCAQNPGGIKIKGGMGFETRRTFQETVGYEICGDGTVPYASLQYPRVWMEDAKKNGKSIEIVEIEGADHRDMLSEDVLFYVVLTFLSGSSISFDVHKDK
eukprot:CAMPEP_0119135150 /NCGR_PEP_ID=MMETSP1310-20130426/18732_1 /TAXON_ID=464262 /ORGANISM="Genus nov. species nov., Strain RCC2339" /LENGTH=730 /DNA_ID=CAMNT_0007126009 /DNA_START=45 /DNA_END=2237 /DNA_ORIENTATION=+